MKSLGLTIRLAIKGIFTNLGRSILTMLGIIIGVASVITIIAVGDGAQSLLTGTIAKAGTKNITVLAGAADDNGPPAAAQGIVSKTLTMKDVDAISYLPHVVVVSGETSGGFDVSFGKESVNTSVEGVSHEYLKINSASMEMGRWWNEKEALGGKNVVVLGFEMATDLVGDDSKNKSLTGEKVKMGKAKYTVLGVLEPQGSQVFGSADDRAFVPTQNALKKLLNRDYLQTIKVHVDAEENVSRTQENIRKKLRFTHKIKQGEEDDFSVRAVAQALSIIGGITSAVSAFLAVIAGVSLIVGGIGIMNIMLMNVNQRTREIGLRKAIGAKPGQIRLQFLTESLVLTILGGIIGTLIGIAISWGIYFGATAAGYEWVFEIRPEAVALGVGVAALIGIIFGIGPAKKAAALNAIDALRYE